MVILENLVNYVYTYVAENGKIYLKNLEVDIKIPRLPFKRITYDEAIRIAKDNGEQIEWGDDLSTESEHSIGKTIGEHYFITDWPSKIKPFYALPYEDKPELCRAFDMMHPRMELSSGAQRVHNYELLRNRITAQDSMPMVLISTSRPSNTHAASFWLGIGSRALAHDNAWNRKYT